MKQFFISCICLTLVLFNNSNAVQAQITVQNTMTPNQLVQNVLMGFGVVASNVTVNGSATNANNVIRNATYFDAGTNNFPIGSGVLLTTGHGVAAVGPNNSGTFSANIPSTAYVGADPHLNAIANGDVENGIILEFDFIPSGDTLSFNYMFGSDEYPEFSPSDFNDAFGFFLWGPGISGPHALAGYPNGGMNIARLPGTNTPVTINNVNPSTNNAYYVNNIGGATYGPAIQYDGTSILMSADAIVQCGETYHIKLAIGNVMDDAYDSGVFLQANSFQSDAVQVQIATVSGNDVVFEGCTDATIQFIRPVSQINDTLTIDYTIGGTATMGTDYNNLINPITFLPGQDTIVLTITPIADGIPDNGETITITAEIINVCGDTIVSTGTLIILDSVVLDLDFINPTVFCIRDSIPVSVVATGGFGPYDLSWSNGDIGNIGYLDTKDSVQGTLEYIVTATDACGYTGIDTVRVTVNQTLYIDTLISTPATCLPIGTIFTESFPYGALLQNPSSPTSYNLTFDWTYEGDTTASFPNQSSLENLSPGWYYLELTDDVAQCSVKDSVFVEAVNVPSAQLSGDPGAGCSPLEVTFTNSSQNSNQYFWNFGDGTTTVVSDLNDQTHTFYTTSIIQLVASNGDVTCNDTTTVQIDLVTCGCMDPTALNYNPDAVISDNNCIYPTPTATPPNVVTLNGDGVNDLFFIETTNADHIELTITNRWGNVIYYGEGNQLTPPIWTGKNAAGKAVSPGVYFYKYKVVGKLGDTLEGHGFLTVVN